MSESPAAVIRRAAALMRKRAEAATPGPWERPLDTRHRNFVMAALPEGEEGSYLDGTIPVEFASHKGPTGRYAGQRERVSVISANIWSIGGFIRKRSGRDLDYIASMNPLVALSVADWLDAAAQAWDEGMEWDEGLAVACAYLGEPTPAEAGIEAVKRAGREAWDKHHGGAS